ncbi:MAG: type II toxin-antitoxin system VapC family toxin [Treponema sp.]|nr:type II toxin-antitoxin system VapC family toxin [Treponema sp.]
MELRKKDLKSFEMRKLYLLDTNIVSEPTRRTPDPKVITNIDEKSLFSVICAPVWYELQKGVELLPDGKKKSMLWNYNNDYVRTVYPILPYDEHCATIQADIFGRMIKNGTPVSASDAQIAATALANNLIIVTRNTKDFEPIQKEFSLCVENWFE